MDMLNRIYASIAHPDYDIRVRLVRLLLHTTKSFGEEEYAKTKMASVSVEHMLKRTSRFFGYYYSSDEMSPRMGACDHVFYINDFEIFRKISHKEDPSQVLTQVPYAFSWASICRREGNNYTFTSNVNLSTPLLVNVMAHELAHNLGASSDMGTACANQTHVMSTRLVANSSSYQFSRCTAQELSTKLKKSTFSFGCLTPNNTTPQEAAATNREASALLTYARLAKRMPLAGLYLSLGDQCQLITGDSLAHPFYLKTNASETSNCQRMQCVTVWDALVSVIPLDGAWCGLDMVCYMGECLPLSVVLGTHYAEQKTKPKTLSKKRTWSLVEQQVRTVRNTCPTGLDYYHTAKESAPSEFTENDAFIYTHRECKNLFDSSFPFLFTKTSKSFEFYLENWFANVCCESYLAYKLIQKTYDGWIYYTFVLPTCENLLPDNPCYNGGTCVTTTSKLRHQVTNESDAKWPWLESFRCECASGFFGRLCMQYDPCKIAAKGGPSPCKRNELCFAYGDYGMYYCLCPRDHPDYPHCGDGDALQRDRPFINNSRLLRRFINYLFVALFLLTVLVTRRALASKQRAAFSR